MAAIFSKGNPSINRWTSYESKASYINGGTTFVHVRFVENYGAKASWDPKTKTATISQNGKEIK